MAESNNLQDAVRKFAADLAARMNTFMADVATLEVRTFTTPMDQVETLIKTAPDLRRGLGEGKAALRAYTSVSFDGDTNNWVPVSASGEVDKGLWELHQAAVKQAMENRAATITAIAHAAAGALKALQSL